MNTQLLTSLEYVKKSALLENSEAHIYYRKPSASYWAAQTRKPTGKATKASTQAHPLRIDPQCPLVAQRGRSWRESAPQPLSFTPRAQGSDRGFPASRWNVARVMPCARRTSPIDLHGLSIPRY